MACSEKTRSKQQPDYREKQSSLLTIAQALVRIPDWAEPRNCRKRPVGGFKEPNGRDLHELGQLVRLGPAVWPNIDYVDDDRAGFIRPGIESD